MALHITEQLLKEQAVDRVSTKDPFQRASTYTGISVSTLRKIHKEWKETGVVKITEVRRGKYERERHWSRHWISNIRNIALRLNQSTIPVTIPQIQKELNLH
jgi:hypothetical protein